MINGVKIKRPLTKVGRADRPHHRTTIITTTRKTFNQVRDLKEGETLEIEGANDVISSARGGKDNIHHSIRRVSLLRRAIDGGFRRVRVRWEQGNELHCVMAEKPRGDVDACTFRVKVSK